MKIENKKVILTGAGSGIGRALALSLLKKGAFVYALDINKENLIETKKLSDNSERIFLYNVDISNKENIETFKEEYLSENEYVDILINNAGIIQPFVELKDLTDNTINKVMNVNFFGTLNLTRTFLYELLKRNEAHIVNVSSMGGFFPFPKQSVYGASKAALKLMTESLYAELLNTNVNISLVFPGAINTNISKNSNVEVEGNSKNYKMTTPEKAASEIIKAIEKNKFKVYIGSDSKFMNFIYKVSPKKAIKLINKKMKDLN